MRKLITAIVLVGMSQFLLGVNVTFQANLATFSGGATDSTSTVHIRGDMNSWGDTNPLTHVSGDIWSVTLDLAAGTYGYKLTHTDALGALTWEDNIGGNRSITVESTEMTVEHYFDALSAPYTATDSVDVWFRVNMAGVVAYDGTSPVGVRGSLPIDPTWETAEGLTQEGDTDFYSGVIRFPSEDVGDTITYKFVWGPLSGWDGVNWESPKKDTWETSGNRYFFVGNDTTLAWQYFSDEAPVAALDTFAVTFVLNTSTLDNFTDSTAIGFSTGNYDSWNHYNDTLTTVGDYSSITLDFVGPADGYDFDYKFLYQIPATEETVWEGVADRSATVTGDTTIFHYWDDNAPFVATDSVDVWFRVNMAGVAAYDGEPVAVRGSIPHDPTWETGYELTQEGDSDYYSGLMKFPTTDIGDTITYKFVWGTGAALTTWDNVNWEQPTIDTWETSGNRYFFVGSDTTLAFKYFSDEPPTGQEAVTAYVYFTVDMAAYEEMGLFSVVKKDSVQVRGGFNGWAGTAAPDGSDLKALRIPNTTYYELNAPVTKFVDTDDYYKYYIKLSAESLDDFMDANDSLFYEDIGYENPPLQGAGNRSYTFEGDVNNPQIIGLEYYNGLPAAGIVPDGHTVTLTHSVDMSGIISQTLFDPATDTVRIIFQDHWSLYLQGMWIADNYYHPDLVLNDAGTDGDATAGDQIYTVTYDITGMTPLYIMYVYEIHGVNALSEGGGYDFGRYRIRYIVPEGTNASNLTWPTTWTFPQDTWTTDPPLVVEDPPAAIFTVGVGDEPVVPQEFTVFQNYPNPFNPETEIKFYLSEAGLVKMNIYNILGQKVLSYENEFISKGTYGLRWNGTDNHGQAVSSGVYFYEIVTANHRITKKMTLLK